MFQPELLRFHLDVNGIVFSYDENENFAKEENLFNYLNKYQDKDINFGLAILGKVDFFSDGIFQYDHLLNKITLTEKDKVSTFMLNDYAGMFCTFFASHKFEAKSENPRMSSEELKKSVEFLKSILDKK
jgi:hypothetical protein